MSDKTGGAELSQAEKEAIAKRLIEAERAEVLKRKAPVRTESKIVVPNFGRPILSIVPTLKERAKAEEAEEKVKAKTNGAGPNFTFKEAPKEEPKAEPKPETSKRGDKPTIQLGPKDSPRLGDVVEAAMQCLVNNDVKIFRRGGALMRPVIEWGFDSEGNPVKYASLIQVDKDGLKLILTRYVNPGSEIGRLILGARGDWPFPEVSGLINAPTLRPDGSPLNKEGYDKATGLLLINAPSVSVNPRPSMAKRALRLDSFLSRSHGWFGLAFKAHPHMLRHACGYALANEGHDTRALQAYLGHSDPPVLRAVGDLGWCFDHFQNSLNGLVRPSRCH